MSTTSSVSDPRCEPALCARFLAAMSQVNADAHLVWRGRTFTADCLVQIGGTSFLLRFDCGSVRECVTQLPLLVSWTFAVRGTPAAWAALWEDPPAPGWHDLFALFKRGEMTFAGDLRPFMAHLQYCKDVLSLPRKVQA